MAAAASVPWSDNPAAFRDWQIGRMIELSRGLREPALHVYASKNIAVRAYMLGMDIFLEVLYYVRLD